MVQIKTPTELAGYRHIVVILILTGALLWVLRQDSTDLADSRHIVVILTLTGTSVGPDFLFAPEAGSWFVEIIMPESMRHFLRLVRLKRQKTKHHES